MNRGGGSLTARDQRKEPGPHLASARAAKKQLVLAAGHNVPQRPLGVVVEIGERWPSRALRQVQAYGVVPITALVAEKPCGAPGSATHA